MNAIDSLRAVIEAMEQPAGRQAAPVRFGGAGSGAALDGTLLHGCLHEFGGPAATLFAAVVLARCEGPVLWCGRASHPGALHPPGLAQMGLDPGRLSLARLRAADDLLHAAHEGLCGGWHVVLDGIRPLDLTGARRLQLAAEAGGGLGLALDGDGAGDTPLVVSAATRWRAGFAGRALWPSNVRLDLRLVRARARRPGQWIVEWNHASRSLCVVSPSCDRQDRAPRSAVA